MTKDFHEIEIEAMREVLTDPDDFDAYGVGEVIDQCRERIETLETVIATARAALVDPLIDDRTGKDKRDIINVAEIERDKLQNGIARMIEIRDQKASQEAADQKARAVVAAKSEFDTAHAAFLAELQRLPGLVAAFDVMKSAHTKAHQLGVTMAAPDVDFAFAQNVVFHPCQYAEKFVTDCRKIADANTPEARDARDARRREDQRLRAIEAEEKAERARREKAERAEQVKVAEQADRERRMKRAGIVPAI